MHTATPSQSAAIEADPKPLLVVAGPGSGKTLCLIERIRFIIERHGIAPDRICAFTFTNKAAEEIANRLDQLGPKAALVKRATIHRFRVEVLRERGRDSYNYSINHHRKSGWDLIASTRSESRRLIFQLSPVAKRDQGQPRQHSSAPCLRRRGL